MVKDPRWKASAGLYFQGTLLLYEGSKCRHTHLSTSYSRSKAQWLGLRQQRKTHKLRHSSTGPASTSPPPRHQEPAEQRVLASTGRQEAQRWSTRLCSLFVTIPLRRDLLSLQSHSGEACSDPKPALGKVPSGDLPHPSTRQSMRDRQPAEGTQWLLSRVEQ